MRLRAPQMLAALAAAALVSACSESRVITLEPAPADLFDHGAPLEITGSESVAKRHGYFASGAGQGAATGMLQGAGGAIVGGAQSGEPLGLALGILLAPVFAVGGGIYGAAAAHPSDEADASEAAMEAVYDDAALLGGVTRDVSTMSSGVGFPEPRHCALDEGREVVADSRGDSSGITCPAPAANRLRLTTVYAFATEGTYSPDLKFGIEVDAVAASAGGAAEAREFRWVYASPALDFFDATRNDAAVLRAALTEAERWLAGQIVDDLFFARREVKVAGTYYPNATGANFRPAGTPSGVVARVPTRSELIALPEASLSE